MKNLEHIGNHFKGIARDPQILLDFHRGCQRFPESQDPQGKGRKEKKTNIYIYIYYIYIHIVLSSGERGSEHFFLFDPPPTSPPTINPPLTAGYGKRT